jgi:O-antigen/teichoic acid export membrane protein
MKNLRTIPPSIINVLALAISSAVTFGGMMMWVRLLSPSQFGVYSLVSGTGLLLNSIAFEWIKTLSSRMLYKKNAKHLIDGGLAYKLISILIWLSLLLFLASLIVSFLLDEKAFSIPLYWFPLTVLFAVSEIAIGLVNAISRMRFLHWQFFFSMVLRSFLVVAFGLFFVKALNMGPFGLIVGITVAQFISALGAIYFDPVRTFISLKRIIQVPSIGDLQRISLMGTPLVISNGIIYFVSIVDRYLIGLFLGYQFVGYYSAPSDLITKSLGLLMLALNLSFFPDVVRSYEDGGPDCAKIRISRNISIQILILAIPLLTFSCFSRDIAQVALGLRYREVSGSILGLLSVSVALRFLNANNIMLIFQLEKKMSYMVLAPAVSAIVVFPCAIVGMKYDGVQGMAVAALIAQIASWLISLFFAKKMICISIFTSDSCKILIISTILFFLLKLCTPFASLVQASLAWLLMTVAFIMSTILLKLDILHVLYDALNRNRDRRSVGSQRL